MGKISKAVRGVADIYNGASLIVRIIVGLIIGTVLALAMPSCWLALAMQSALPHTRPPKVSCLRWAGAWGSTGLPPFRAAVRARTVITGSKTTTAIQLRPIR